jgi:SHS2 domain-containing protein
MTHELLDHTADLRASLEAPDFPGLLQSAAELMREILVGESPIRAKEIRRIHLEGDDEEQLFRFLRELLYLYDTEGFLPARVEVSEEPTVWGECFDRLRHVAERQLKAVTRHGFRLHRTGDRWQAEVLFDL